MVSSREGKKRRPLREELNSKDTQLKGPGMVFFSSLRADQIELRLNEARTQQKGYIRKATPSSRCPCFPFFAYRVSPAVAAPRVTRLEGWTFSGFHLRALNPPCGSVSNFLLFTISFNLVGDNLT